MLRWVMMFRWIGLAALGLALSACADVGLDSPRRQFSGVWLYEFEGSSFVEGATGIPNRRPDYRETDWLEVPFGDPEIRRVVEGPGFDEAGECYTVQPVLITFIGHRTQRPFGAGHMGLWRSEVTVHETLSIRRLGPAFCYRD